MEGITLRSPLPLQGSGFSRLDEKLTKKAPVHGQLTHFVCLMARHYGGLTWGILGCAGFVGFLGLLTRVQPPPLSFSSGR